MLLQMKRNYTAIFFRDFILDSIICWDVCFEYYRKFFLVQTILCIIVIVVDYLRCNCDLRALPHNELLSVLYGEDCQQC